jgi:2,5-diamino-6-(ribosylamino)-4(3H)-pyrimidinone 5'-phosphate reductase
MKSTRQPNARGERRAAHRRVTARGRAAAKRRAAERPYVICHMAPAVDGRIVTRDWPLPAGLTAEYEGTAAALRGDAWIIGRVSMEPYAGKARLPAIRERLPRTDFIARADAQSYAISIDPAGKLRWESAFIDQDHVVTVLTERVPDRYLAFLRARGVSYLFGGRDHVDVQVVLRKLRGQFGIRRLLLEGGGKINGSFLAAYAIDELSLVIAPVADGAVGTPTLFDAGARGAPRRLQLLSAERRRGGFLWVRYRVRHGGK